MKKTRFEQLMENPEFRKKYAIEGLVAETSEFIGRPMEDQGVNKAELARSNLLCRLCGRPRRLFHPHARGS